MNRDQPLDDSPKVTHETRNRLRGTRSKNGRVPATVTRRDAPRRIGRPTNFQILADQRVAENSNERASRSERRRWKRVVPPGSFEVHLLPRSGRPSRFARNCVRESGCVIQSGNIRDAELCARPHRNVASQTTGRIEPERNRHPAEAARSTPRTAPRRSCRYGLKRTAKFAEGTAKNSKARIEGPEWMIANLS